MANYWLTMKSGPLIAAFFFALSSRASSAPDRQNQPMTPGSKDPQVLKRLEKEWNLAQAAYAKNPKDPKLKERYSVAGVRFGYESMYSPLLPPHQKYPQALRLFHKVLAVDPSNHVARDAANMIESIYRQMHRPIPK